MGKVEEFTVDLLTNEEVLNMSKREFLALARSYQKPVRKSSIEPSEEEEYLNNEWFIEIKKLRNGDYFGELALLKNDPRAATIACSRQEDSSFAVID